ILFNIDSKADQRLGRDAILAVFLKVLNEMQGYCGDQRKYRYPANKMDFTFNRLCDLHPVGNKTDGALFVSVITPNNDDYDLYNNAKCILESGGEGGHVLVRLGNDESLGRELRTHIQTDKYVRQKSDGTLPESTKRILRDVAEDNQERRSRLEKLLAQ